MKISLTHVSKRFVNTLALDDVDCEILPGNIVAVLGANGAGKSTLLRLLSVVFVPSTGEVRYDGELLTRQRLDHRKRVAYLPDTPPMLGNTPLAHIAELMSLYAADIEGCAERAVTILGELDLLPLAECRLSTFSRGQKYKAALAGLLLLDPEVWLIDEPFAAGMDPQGHAVLKRHANKAAARGRTILYTTQILDVAEQFSDKVIVFDRGRLHAYNSVQNLALQSGATNGVLERLFAELRIA